EGRKRASRGIGHQSQRFDVVRMVRPLVVADQRSVRLAARRTELIFVDLFEKLTLVELDCSAQVASQFPLAHVENAQLERRAGFGVLHQKVQSAPAALQLEELRIMNDRIELRGQFGVYRLNGLVECPREISIEGDGSGQRLL